MGTRVTINRKTEKVYAKAASIAVSGPASLRWRRRRGGDFGAIKRELVCMLGNLTLYGHP